MKKKLLLIIPIIIITACTPKSFEPKLTCLQIVDRNGLTETISASQRLEKYKNTDFFESQPYQQVLQVFEKNNENKNKSILTTYHPNGLIKQYLEAIDGRAYGQYKEWHQNGKKKILVNIVGGQADLSPEAQNEWLFDGICIAWDDNGNIISEISYNKGVLDGDSKYYSASGNLLKIIPYKKNKIHGTMIEYHENSKIKLKAEYFENERNGSSFGYTKDENLLFSEEYKNNILMNGKYYSENLALLSEIKNGEGYKTEYSPDGQLYKLIQFKNGSAEGLIQIYSSKGNIVRKYNIKNGIKNGEEIEYYKESDLSINKYSNFKPKPKMSIYWDNNMIHGTVKTWYLSGQLESQKEYSKNKKNGSSCGWYSDSSLMLIEEYENDLLIKGSYYKKNQQEPVSNIIDGNGIATIYDENGSFIRKTYYSKGLPKEE